MSNIIKRREYSVKKNEQKLDNEVERKSFENNPKRNKRNIIFALIFITLILLVISISFFRSEVVREEVEREVYVVETNEEFFSRMDKEYEEVLSEMGTMDREKMYEEIRAEYE